VFAEPVKLIKRIENKDIRNDLLSDTKIRENMVWVLDQNPDDLLEEFDEERRNMSSS